MINNLTRVLMFRLNAHRLSIVYNKTNQLNL